jgi:hypothetical protein
MKKYIFNKWNILLIGLILITTSIILSNQKQKEWRYKIIGYVHYKGKVKDAVWYTDRLDRGENFVKYHNTDGTEVVIPAPYVIIDYRHNYIIKDTDKAFK